MLKQAFDKLIYLPDLIPGEEEHYRSFTQVYGTAPAKFEVSEGQAEVFALLS